jgi:hypothetical protein
LLIFGKLQAEYFYAEALNAAMQLEYFTKFQFPRRPIRVENIRVGDMFGTNSN